MRFLVALLAVGLGVQVARADFVGSITDYSLFDGRHATVDGVYHPLEYEMDPITMSVGSGGGGALHAPGALYFNLNGAVTFGFQPGGPLTHTVIILLDFKAGGRLRGSGAGVTAFNDNTDAARQALSSLQGVLPYNQPGAANSAAVDAAITINDDGFGLFMLPDDQHATFTQIGSYTGLTNPVTGFREGQFPQGTLGAIVGFRGFAVVYADDGVLYNEAVPNQPYSAGANPGQQIGAASPAAIPNYYGIDFYVPAPGTASLLVGAAMLGARRTRRP